MAQITFTIPNNQLAELAVGFLKVHPNPGGMTDLEWLKEYIRRHILDSYKTGKGIIAKEAAIEVIEEIEIT